MKDIKTRPLLLLACMGAQAMPLVTHAGKVQNVIDVLGIYSDHTAQKVADPNALFTRNIEYANKALQNSGANYRYNLVHVQQQNWDSDDGLSGTQLNNFTRNPAIQQLRDDYGADLVAGIVPRSGGLCGIGWVSSANRSNQTFYSWANKYGYSLSGHNCGGRTMAHEMGHNMGLGHSFAQGSKGTLASWGRGHGVNGSFVTIMAYNSAYGVSGAGSMQIHSSPSLNVCKGQACGQSINNQDGADAVQALNLASPQIGKWKESAVTVPENDPPVAVNDKASTDAGKTVTINAVQNDSDPNNDAITISSVSMPKNGKAVIQIGATKIVYTPNSGFDGNDSFSYTISDSQGATATASVSVQVKAVTLLPGGSSDNANLVKNGGAELGLNGWIGAWGAKIGISNDAHSGNNSIQSSSGLGVFADLHTPIEGNKNLAVSGWIKANSSTTAYVFLRLKRNGSWRYQYMTAISLAANKWVNFDRARYVSGPQIDDGSLLLYFPRGMGKVKIDDINVKFK